MTEQQWLSSEDPARMLDILFKPELGLQDNATLIAAEIRKGTP